MKQRKVGLIALLLLAFSSTIFAQGITKKGIKTGLNIATLTGNYAEGSNPRIGFVYGCFVKYELNNRFSLQPEVLFTMKGAKFEYSGIKATNELNYIEIPVLVKLHIPLERRLNSNVFIGPALSIKITATCERESDDEVHERDIDNIPATDFGLVSGAEVEFGRLTVEFRYNYGLTSIDGQDIENFFNAENRQENTMIKNSVISIMLGFSF